MIKSAPRKFLTVAFLLFLFSCYTYSLNKNENTETIEFEKTGCLGKCKIYKIAVSSNGSATYQGISNVSKIGKYFRKLKKGENENLWKIINKDSLLKMNEAYNYGDEDTQQQFLRYFSDGKLIKEIRFGPFPPDNLKQIDSALEVISEKKGWKISK
jgi:hypothetical protein